MPVRERMMINDRVDDLSRPPVGPGSYVAASRDPPSIEAVHQSELVGREESFDDEGGMNNIVEGQRRLEQQALQLAKRMQASHAIMEGQRRLEKQLEMMARQMNGSAAPQRTRRRQGPSDQTSKSSAQTSRDDNYADNGSMKNRDDVYDQEAAYGADEDGRYSDGDRYSDDEGDNHDAKPNKVRNRNDQHAAPDSKMPEGDPNDPHARPSLRHAGRLLSWRRNHTLARLHGDSPIYYVAWLAEWATCAAFTVAHLVMLILWARHDGNQDSYVTTLFVTAIAAATYLMKACHMGDFEINGIVVPLPRYIDWLTTTPLMLYEICHIAHASFGMTFMVILSDILMIVTGMIEAMIPWRPHKAIKQVWFFMSCWFYVILLAVLHFDVAKKAEKQNEVAANLFSQLEVLTVAVWSMYPIIVGIGRANTGLIAKPHEDIALCFMDVIAKIGMEGLIVAACFQGCIDKTAAH